MEVKQAKEIMEILERGRAQDIQIKDCISIIYNYPSAKKNLRTVGIITRYSYEYLIGEVALCLIKLILIGKDYYKLEKCEKIMDLVRNMNVDKEGRFNIFY